MRVNKIIYFLLITLAIVAGVWWYVTRDERVIKKVIKEVAEYASNEESKGDIANALASQNLAERFTEEAIIKWRWPEWPLIKSGEDFITGRDKIKESAIIAKRGGNLLFEVENLKIRVENDAGVANATILLNFTDTGDLATFETVFDLVKNNTWQINKVEARPVKNKIP